MFVHKEPFYLVYLSITPDWVLFFLLLELSHTFNNSLETVLRDFGPYRISQSFIYFIHKALFKNTSINQRQIT